MKEFRTFLERLGGLHDSVVHRLAWAPGEKTLQLEIEDLCSNFKGLPEYPGAMPGVITLSGIEQISFALDTNEKRLKVYEFELKPESADTHCASLSFSPSGKITVLYRAADFPEVRLRA